MKYDRWVPTCAVGKYKFKIFDKGKKYALAIYNKSMVLNLFDKFLYKFWLSKYIICTNLLDLLLDKQKFTKRYDSQVMCLLKISPF